MPQATALSPQTLIEAAKAMLGAYNDKDWDKARASMTSDFVYDEVATQRRTTGADEAIALWKGWAQAFPDSKATFHDAVAQGDTAVLEVTWKGTHQGPLQMPSGPVAATGKRIEVRACCVVQLSGEKARLQRHYFDMVTMLEQLGLKS